MFDPNVYGPNEAEDFIHCALAGQKGKVLKKKRKDHNTTVDTELPSWAITCSVLCPLMRLEI